MIQVGAVADAENAFDRAESLIVSSEDEAGDSRIDQCSGTHCTRFDGRIKGRTRQTIVANADRSNAESEYFGVSGRIDICDRTVRRGGQYLDRKSVV